MIQPAPSLFIRRATSADANLVAVIGSVTFYEAYFEQDDPVDLVNYIAESFDPAKIGQEIESPDSTFFLTFLGGKAVGYAKLREDSRVDCVESANCVELQRIYIVERALGRGIGEMLLRHCLDAAREKGFEALWLSVWKENRRAIRFYEKHGFRAVGMISFPFGAAEGTNWIMEKNL